MRCRFDSFPKGAGLIAGSLFFACAGVLVKSADDSPPATVNFASWNLRNYLHTTGDAPSKTKAGTATKSPAEQAAITRIIVSLKPDILGVCEMGSAEDLAALQQRLKEAGLDLPHSEHIQAADTERHLALLSRFPVAAKNSQTKLTYLLDDTMLPVQRGFLDVTLQITPSYQLRCLGVHLKSRRDVPEADESLMRRNEAHLLRQHADKILTDSPETNLLVYGDFNDTRETAAVRAIGGIRGAATALTPVAAADDAGERWTYYFAQTDTYSRIDFLFASRGLNPELEDRACRIYSGADWFKASDHRPVTALIHPVDKKIRARKTDTEEKKDPDSEDQCR